MVSGRLQPTSHQRGHHDRSPPPHHPTTKGEAYPSGKRRFALGAVLIALTAGGATAAYPMGEVRLSSPAKATKLLLENETDETAVPDTQHQVPCRVCWEGPRYPGDWLGGHAPYRFRFSEPGPPRIMNHGIAAGMCDMLDIDPCCVV